MSTYQQSSVVQLTSSGLALLATLADPDDPDKPHPTADYVDMAGYSETGPLKDDDGTILAYEYTNHGLTLPDGVRSSLLLHLGAITGYSTFALARAGGVVELGRLSIGPSVKNTLTTAEANQIAAAIAGGSYEIQRGDTATLTFAGLGDISDRSKFWFCGKYERTDGDEQAAFLVEETDDLVYIHKRAPRSGETGTITITDENAGDGYLTLSAKASQALKPASAAHWDIQILRTDGTVATLAENDPDADPAQHLKISLDVTRRIS